ncbi:hypothetical protein D3C75_1188080 [compost metagenome]
MLLQAENCRAARSFVCAHSLEHAHAIVKCVGQNVSIGLTPLNQLAIFPDFPITI